LQLQLICEQGIDDRMKSFLFSTLRDGVADPEGDSIELSSVAAARLEAAKVLLDIMRDDVEQEWQVADWEIIVSDDQSLTLFSLSVSTGARNAPTLLR
jgi:hypothetical protein